MWHIYLHINHFLDQLWHNFKALHASTIVHSTHPLAHGVHHPWSPKECTSSCTLQIDKYNLRILFSLFAMDMLCLHTSSMSPQYLILKPTKVDSLWISYVMHPQPMCNFWHTKLYQLCDDSLVCLFFCISYRILSSLCFSFVASKSSFKNSLNFWHVYYVLPCLPLHSCIHCSS